MKKMRWILIWLVFVELVILLTVAVGGITRLTNSGLSMVEWKPVLGAIPPLNAEAWEVAFEKYKQHSEFQQLRPGMNLSEFKWIYFWEYVHRMLGRFVGIVFAIPFVFFLCMKRLDRLLAIKLGVALLLGGAQGLMGWFMVKSGLAEVPQVSHYRLAAHLLLALGLFCYIFWIILTLVTGGIYRSRPTLKTWAWVIFILVIVQIMYGAFVAGLNAGFTYNTFPKMLGHWIPPGWLNQSPVWINFLQNEVTVQWVHRSLGWVLLLGVSILWIRSFWLSLALRQRVAVHLLMGGICLQFLLGVLTLIWMVPISIAVLHQLLGGLLLGNSFFLLYTNR